MLEFIGAISAVITIYMASYAFLKYRKKSAKGKAHLIASVENGKLYVDSAGRKMGLYAKNGKLRSKQ